MLIISIIIILTLFVIEGELRKSRKQNEEIIDLLKQIKKNSDKEVR